MKMYFERIAPPAIKKFKIYKSDVALFCGFIMLCAMLVHFALALNVPMECLR